MTIPLCEIKNDANTIDLNKSSVFLMSHDKTIIIHATIHTHLKFRMQLY